MGLYAQLSQCNSVEDMHQLVIDQGINLHQNPKRTVPFSKHSLNSRSRWPVQEVAKFLTEPVFNPSSTTHHLHLLTGVRQAAAAPAYIPQPLVYKQFLLPDNWRILQTAFCRAAQLGLITPDALQDIVDEIFEFPLGVDKRPDVEVRHQNVFDLLASFQDSTLFRIQDLSHEWKNKLVSKLLTEPLTHPSIRLLFLLKDQLDLVESALNDLRVNSIGSPETFLRSFPESTLTKILASVTERTLTPLAIQLLLRFKDEQYTVELLVKAIMGSLDICGTNHSKMLLQNLRHSTLARVLAAVTEQCILSMRGGNMEPQVMRSLGDILSSQDNSTFCDWLLDNANFTTLRECLSDQLSRQEQYLVALWILLRLCRPKQNHSPTTLSDISDRLRLHEEFDTLFPIASGTLLRNRMHHIFLVTQGLPFFGSFAEDLAILANEACLSDTHRTDTNTDLAVLDAQSIADTKFSSLMDDELYGRLRTKSLDGLGEFCEIVNVDLPAFTRLARKVIHGDKYALRIVKRVLQNNASLKTSLSQSWPQRRVYHKRSEELNEIMSSEEAPWWGSHLVTNPSTRKETGPMPTPVDSLEVIERLALSFALSPALLPRSALIQVYWCYTYLHRYGAPITPAISRALWHAGVVRYGGKGPAVTQVQWILKVVEEVEGKGVARMLLWNSKFRHHREQLLKSLDADDQQKGPRNESVLLEENIQMSSSNANDEGASARPSLPNAGVAADQDASVFPERVSSNRQRVEGSKCK